MIQSIYKTILFILISISLMLSLSGCATKKVISPPMAVKGVIDLSNWDFDKYGSVELDGQWEYYPQKLYTPQELDVVQQNEFDGLKHYEVSELLIPIGRKVFKPDKYGTYQLKVYVNPESLYALNSFSDIFDTHKIWVDNIVVDSNGSMDDYNFQESIVAKKLLNFNLQSNYFLITVQSKKITPSLILDKEKNLATNEDTSKTIQSVLLVCILIIAAYHIILYIFRRNDKSAIYFVYFCFSVLILQITSDYSNNLYDKGINNVVFLFISKAGLWYQFIWNLSVSLIEIFSLLFFYILFKIVFNKKIIFICIVIIVFGIFHTFIAQLFLVNGKSNIYNLITSSEDILVITFIIFILYVLVRSVKMKLENSLVILSGMIIFGFTCIIDVLSAQGLIFIPKTISFGTVFFIFFQAIAIARRFSNAFLEVEKLSDRLLSMDKLKDDFMAHTSNELKAPLNGIMGLAEGMLDGATGKLSNAQKHNLEFIRGRSLRLFGLINQIQDFLKLEHRELQLLLKNIDLKELTNVAIEEFQPVLKRKNLKIINEIPDEMPVLKADENRMMQVLYNLIGNAVRFTDVGTIKISAKGDAHFVVMSIKDTGIGIAKDKQQIIFEVFEQADGSIERRYGGTGLGLNITKKLIELHGGKIWVDSDVGVGATFYFTLPVNVDVILTRAQPQNRDMSRAKQLAEQQKSTLLSVNNEAMVYIESDEIDEDIKGNKKGNILVVDDEEVNIQVMSNLLKTQGYTVHVATNGIDALKLLFSEMNQKIDLAMIDIMMPKMSGYELTKKIREAYAMIELPVILLSSEDESKNLEACFDLGANDYLQKPFKKREILSRVDTQISLMKMVEDSIETAKKLQEEHISREMAEMYADELKMNNMELSEALDTLQKTQQQLIQSEKMASLGCLVAGVAHEINTPIGVSVTANSHMQTVTKEIYEEFSQNQIKKSTLVEYFQDITTTSTLVQKNLLRAGELITSFKRLSVDLSSEDMRKFKLSECFGDIIISLSSKIGKHKIKVDCSDDIEILSNPGAMSQIITNFIINSLMHAFDNESEGIINIQAAIKENKLCIEYSDNGKGIPKENLSKIYDPFYTTNRGGGGTGLGLNIVFNIVSKTLKGVMTCNSEVGKGTKFIIEMPVG